MLAVLTGLGMVPSALFATVALGLRLPASSLLAGLPLLRDLDYSPDTFGRVAPLGQEFLSDTLGLSALSLIEGARPGAGPPRPSPNPGANPTPGTTPNPFPSLPPVLSQPELTISTSSNRATVAPGGEIVYTIVVRNIGERIFKGAFEMTAHVPFGTGFSCERGCLPGDPGPTASVAPGYSIPGPPGDTHTVNLSVNYASGGPDDGIRPGMAWIYTYTVEVYPSTQPGTQLSNHAHLDVTGDARPAMNSNTVIVAVR